MFKYKNLLIKNLSNLELPEILQIVDVNSGKLGPVELKF